QGALRDSGGNKIDRVVDGGFFENFGVTTANDLARVLIAHQLRPVILLITNDPTSVERIRQLDDLDRVSPRLPDAREAPPLAWLIAPLEALYATRTSRGELAILRTGQEAHGSEQGVVHVPVANITVYGEPVSRNSGNDLQYKEVSWSWWLSKPVQEYLDNQFFLKSYAGGLEDRPDGGGPWDGEQVLMFDRVCEWLADPRDPTKALVDQCKNGIRAFLQQR